MVDAKKPIKELLKEILSEKRKSSIKKTRKLTTMQKANLRKEQERLDRLCLVLKSIKQNNAKEMVKNGYISKSSDSVKGKALDYRRLNKHISSLEYVDRW